MFIGEYSHNLDSKGRLAVPAKFRGQLKGGAVVTKGLDNCLFVYPRKEWRAIAEKLANMPIKARAMSRLMLAGAMEVDFDSQGRIVLPEYLRKFANLEKTVVVAGLYDKIEVWNKDEWKKYKASAENNSAEMAETLGELGV